MSTTTTKIENPARKGDWVAHMDRRRMAFDKATGRCLGSAMYIRNDVEYREVEIWTTQRVASAYRDGTVKTLGAPDCIPFQPYICMILSEQYHAAAASLAGQTFDSREALKAAILAAHEAPNA